MTSSYQMKGVKYPQNFIAEGDLLIFYNDLPSIKKEKKRNFSIEEHWQWRRSVHFKQNELTGKI